MNIKNILDKLKNLLLAKWVVCKIISDKKSVQYGIYFSYPIYIASVLAGIFLQNPYILTILAVIAFLGIKLPLHPFDYIYNNIVVKLLGTKKIPGRGSELQVNSIVALIFNLTVIVLIIFSIPLNFSALAIIYALSSVSIISIFLFKD